MSKKVDLKFVRGERCYLAGKARKLGVDQYYECDVSSYATIDETPLKTARKVRVIVDEIGNDKHVRLMVWRKACQSVKQD